MKRIKKRFLAMSVCLAVLYCSLAPVQITDAASKTAKLTVRYKGKNVTFMTYRSISSSNANVKTTLNSKTYAAVKKTWGKASKTKKEDYGNNYIWKSGKTKISFYTYENGKRRGDIYIDIRNKKASLCGVKVGMSKKQALQKLRKQFGKKRVTSDKNQILVNVPPADPIVFNLKSGKVKSIMYWCS